ncbi:MAG: phosphoribosylformylglycinamidine synthase subunit PurQ [Rhodospirillaceae bacterium]|mgnify:CR=1 FL=1|jgi:phosphoribosylformylglycinamidine synthase|nr:phosphoribosylformylglycinamidine synthase subunit PurQ [Rhodospirillaceae bacterium]MBT4044085.1 phosphoribosylformylglycinamidine synthase subunit PurQ [Rhodospirillaceae bacterium]MBT4688094.1 phosphoribosylformylglycinamidine synthase subunit PurQ [Rhodospirillaceae bacterium]MBT5081758.1 phosphoribosylformylglycinamidine synthase subunit PurQ [Rhodospirillaceae bacterium]MBT5527380.1 phosphoribosylformylglycinamidine synthase subunit PurQ [Rhodospirillaceae bacterium]
MKASVIVFPGSNCDRDVQVALADAIGGTPDAVDMVWHGDREMAKTDLIVLPGGFSYGDYLRSGAMSARSPVMREVIAQAEQGVAVLGICNGFQILTEAGLLPGALLRNSDLKFVCRDVHIRVENSQTPFTNAYEAGQTLRIPVAHHDGQYFVEADELAGMRDQDQIAFRYCTGDDDREANHTANPNGSIDDIAGVFNKRKTVLGLMPHPERAADATHGGTDGRAMLSSLVSALA